MSSGFPTPSARVRWGGCFDTLRLVVDEAVLAARRHGAPLRRLVGWRPVLLGAPCFVDGPLVVIGGVTALLFGPSKLPELGKSLGKTVKSFQSAANEFNEELKKEVKDGEKENEEVKKEEEEEK